VREVQLFECFATAGSFHLQYGVENTTAISALADAATLKAALEELRAVSSVEVEFTNNARTAVCHNSTGGTNVVKITFNDFFYQYKADYGSLSTLNRSADLPNIVAHTEALLNVTTAASYAGTFHVATDGLALPRTRRSSCTETPAGWTSSTGATCAEYETNSWCTSSGGYGTGWPSGTFADTAVSGIDASHACCECGGGVSVAPVCPEPCSPVAQSALGTRQHLECSGRGICDGMTGLCACQQGYVSSNGINGTRGQVPDCGHIM
jgi:hypothetical protein